MEFWGSEGTAFVLGPPFATSYPDMSTERLESRIYPTYPFCGNLSKYTVLWGSDNAHDVQ